MLLMTGVYSAGIAESRVAQVTGKPVILGKTFTIGIAEHKVAQAPDRVATLGLGSCVGLVLYDPVSKIGGMVHIMLPTAPKDGPVTNRSKFADTGIVDLMRAVAASGAMRGRLIAKFTGGAHMFNAVCNNDIMNVGERNVQMCKKVLQEHAIRIAAEDTGGTCGRSIELCCESGMLQVRTISPKSVRLL
jgi:chemotaxis protein CheD